jgi:hypothetical protein
VRVKVLYEQEGGKEEKEGKKVLLSIHFLFQVEDKRPNPWKILHRESESGL